MIEKRLDNYELGQEWESFEWPIKIHHVESQNKNYDIPEDAIITIFRNDSYKLSGTITGSVANRGDLGYTPVSGSNPKEGELIEGDILTGYDASKSKKFRITDFFIGDKNFSHSNVLSGKVETTNASTDIPIPSKSAHRYRPCCPLPWRAGRLPAESGHCE